MFFQPRWLLRPGNETPDPMVAAAPRAGSGVTCARRPHGVAGWYASLHGQWDHEDLHTIQQRREGDVRTLHRFQLGAPLPPLDPAFRFQDEGATEVGRT